MLNLLQIVYVYFFYLTHLIKCHKNNSIYFQMSHSNIAIIYNYLTLCVYYNIA